VFSNEKNVQFKNNYFTEICSGSEAGSYLRLIDVAYHSTLGLRVIMKKNEFVGTRVSGFGTSTFKGSYSRLIDFAYHSTLGLGVIKKKRSTSNAACTRAGPSSRVCVCERVCERETVCERKRVRVRARRRRVYV